MKNLAILILTSFFVTFYGCKKDETPNNIPTAPELDLELTEQEKNDLFFLREEEKLARDVYLFSFQKYGVNIFQNISNSEQKHMDQVLVLIEYYGLNDPASSDIGVFSNDELQGLYDDLTAISDSSLIHAYTIGATIEDLDIKDIVLFELNTTKTDLLALYEALVCGSRNHMRGFNNQLESNNITYTPQFITQAEFDDIINGNHETCN